MTERETNKRSTIVLFNFLACLNFSIEATRHRYLYFLPAILHPTYEISYRPQTVGGEPSPTKQRIYHESRYTSSKLNK